MMKKYLLIFSVLLLLDIGALYWMCFIHIETVEEISVMREEDGVVSVKWEKDRRPVWYCLYGSDDGNEFWSIGESMEAVWYIQPDEKTPRYIKIRKKYMGIRGKSSQLFSLNSEDD